MTEDAAVRGLLPLAYLIADRYWLPSGDREDLRQEASLAALHAIRRYQTGHGVTLRQFVAVFVERRCATVLKQAWREKRRAQNEAVSMTVNPDGEVVQIVDFLPGGRDPHDVAVEREQIRTLVDGIRRLTPLERDSLLRCVINGEPYYADGNDGKTYDNAVTRARRKLRAAA